MWVGRHTCWHHGCEHTEECAKEKEGAVVVSLRRLVPDAPVQPAYHEPESTQVFKTIREAASIEILRRQIGRKSPFCREDKSMTPRQ